MRGTIHPRCKPLEDRLRDLTVRPATVEPIWRGDRLTLSDRPSQSQLGEEMMLETFAALRDGLAELGNETALLANCDPRISEYLSKLAGGVPTTPPSLALLIRFGRARDSVRDFLQTVEREWPDLFASRFRALITQFDRTIGQFPSHRHFEDYDRGVVFTEKQMERASDVSDKVAEVLGDDETQYWLDPEIASTLKTIEEPLVPTEATGGLNPSVAHDLLESVSNILKVLIEGAITRLAPAADWARSTVIESGKAFADHAKASLVDEAGKAGDKVGPSIGKVLKRLRGVTILGCGAVAVPAMPLLIKNYLTVFGWLEPFLRFIERL